MRHIPRALATRLARLEHAIIPPRKGYLQVFRYRQETEVQALSRYGIDAAEWPQVHIWPWVGRGEPPRPGWICPTWAPGCLAGIEEQTQQANARLMQLRREGIRISPVHVSGRMAWLEARHTLPQGGYTARAIAARRETRQLWCALRDRIDQLHGG